MSLLNVRGVRNTKYHVIPYPLGHNSRNSGFSTQFPIILKQKCKKPLTPWDSLHICPLTGRGGGLVALLPRLSLQKRRRFTWRSEEHTSELQSLMRISYAVFCLKKKNNTIKNIYNTT